MQDSSEYEQLEQRIEALESQLKNQANGVSRRSVLGGLAAAGAGAGLYSMSQPAAAQSSNNQLGSEERRIAFFGSHGNFESLEAG